MSEDDLDDVAALLGNETVMAYYPRPKTRDETQGWISWNRRLYAEYGFGLWLVTLTETGQFLGECGLTIQRVDGVDHVEIGYQIRPEHQCHGYERSGAAMSASCTCRATADRRTSVHATRRRSSR